MADEIPTPQVSPPAPAKPDYQSYVGKTTADGITVTGFAEGYSFPGGKSIVVPAFLITTDHERIQRYVPADPFLSTKQFKA